MKWEYIYWPFVIACLLAFFRTGDPGYPIIVLIASVIYFILPILTKEDKE
jgi:hypothetical protein